MALKEVRDIRSLMSETKTPQPPLVVLFPDGMHRYTKFNDGEGAYILRFNNGLGARVFFESAKEGERIAMYEVRWGPEARFIEDCVPSYRTLSSKAVPASFEELNGLLETIRDYDMSQPEPAKTGLTISSTGMSTHSRGSTGTGFVFDSETSTWKERPVIDDKWTVSGTWSPIDPTQYTVTYAPSTASATTTTTASATKVLKWEDPA